jgi:hypothetical protein
VSGRGLIFSLVPSYIGNITGQPLASSGDWKPSVLSPLVLGSDHMPDYRVYIIGRDGHFQKSVALDCADDDAAKLEAEQLVDGHDVELWQRDRKVARFERKSK